MLMNFICQNKLDFVLKRYFLFKNLSARIHRDNYGIYQRGELDKKNGNKYVDIFFCLISFLILRY